MTCDPYLSRPILSGLPPVFKVNIRTDRSGHWLENSILHLVEEAASGRVGSDAMLAKLSEALFVDTLRRYVAGLPDQQLGWLAGARDPIVGKSLGLLHSRIAHPWTIADLADEVGISRSALVERFTRYLSEPPMTYLTRWRLQLAARSLEKTSRGVAEIAADVGYESEAAFNRAFKREFGQPPGRYRSDHQEFALQEGRRPPYVQSPRLIVKRDCRCNQPVAAAPVSWKHPAVHLGCWGSTEPRNPLKLSSFLNSVPYHCSYGDTRRVPQPHPTGTRTRRTAAERRISGLKMPNSNEGGRSNPRTRMVYLSDKLRLQRD